jgi:hypothetical protein
MAQWNKIIQDFLNQERSLFEVPMIATKDGNPVSFENPFPVSLGSSSITIVGDITIPTTVSVASSAANPVHTHITQIGSSGLLEDEGIPYMPIGIGTAQNLNLSYLPVGISTFNNIIVIKQSEGSLYSFNNHATNTHRGWTMDDTMRPVMSIRVNSSGTTIADLAEITEYEIGNNNANQSTIIYEWYEGDINIAGAAIPAWNSLGTKLQYRVYQDKYSSNAGNTFTQNSSVMRHSGVIIGKNTSDDEGPSTMHGGASPNMLTLCMKRVDNSTKLDVWFAFTCKELS